MLLITGEGNLPLLLFMGGLKMQIPKLTYNAAAHFNALDKYPDGLANAITEKGRDGFEALCWALSELSTQTELIRRDMGYDKAPIYPPTFFALHLNPVDLLQAKSEVLNAMTRGLNPGDESEEVDEVLAELQKKTGGQR